MVSANILNFPHLWWSRRALANALATAPSMWTLGNAGMGALQVTTFYMTKLVIF